MTSARASGAHLNRRRSKGFSLAEILVALALLALLAAVLMPTVAGQLLKGDASRVTQDLNAIRSGVEQFLADVHRYPGKYSDLSKVITTTTATNVDIYGNGYNSAMVSKWKGPYVSKDTLNSSIETGFGGSVKNTFMRVTNTNAIEYLTVVVTGISATDFDKVDEQVDGPSTGGAGRTSGLLRFVSAGGVDSTKFLAMPLQ
ncbi:MAG TPA: prepilin-type N-terminal cleavage/methylation domain-containing protein [Gemmatimonadaceae bacterium]|nr:prepilin-type N-terminal cleavage/methylation domain-containing protein [Gemmatimonadaceae bacterium]